MPRYVTTTRAPFYTVEAWYTSKEIAGVTALIVAGSISAISVLGLLLSILISTIRTVRNPDKHLFARTHVGLYFISLLVTNLVQAIGGIMNAKWIVENHVSYGGFCTAQAAVKQVGNLGTALWSVLIATHTFNLLFLRLQLKNYVCYGVTITTWGLIGAFVLAGPAAIESKSHGPYFGVTGYWCWINDAYPAPRLFLEYLWVFISAFESFILYTLVFLRLRGNLYMIGWVPHLRWVKSEHAWKLQTGRDLVDTQMMTVARQMLWYPVAYTILILPIAASRYADFAGHSVPFEVTIFAGVVFMLSGFVNVVLFAAMRKVVPKRDTLPSFNVPRGPSVPEMVHKTGIDPFILPGGQTKGGLGINTNVGMDVERNAWVSPTGSERSFVSADVRSLSSGFGAGSVSGRDSDSVTDVDMTMPPMSVGRAHSLSHHRSKSGFSKLSPVNERPESGASIRTFETDVSSGSEVGLIRGKGSVGGRSVDGMNELRQEMREDGEMGPIAKNISVAMGGSVDPCAVRKPGRSRSASLSSKHSKRDVEKAHAQPCGVRL